MDLTELTTLEYGYGQTPVDAVAERTRDWTDLLSDQDYDENTETEDLVYGLIVGDALATVLDSLLRRSLTYEDGEPNTNPTFTAAGELRQRILAALAINEGSE